MEKKISQQNLAISFAYSKLAEFVCAKKEGNTIEIEGTPSEFNRVLAKVSNGYGDENKKLIKEYAAKEIKKRKGKTKT